MVITSITVIDVLIDYNPFDRPSAIYSKKKSKKYGVLYLD